MASRERSRRREPRRRSAAPSTSAATTGVSYDAGTGRYLFSWNLSCLLPAGSCAVLRLTLDDGVTREALFAR
jgi:hypothetical protein